MNGLDVRSSLSSYGDPRHSASYGASQPPPTQMLRNSYRDASDPQQRGKSPVNPLNTNLPRNSALLHTHDPVAMYLLTETAMSDSIHYEILSLEEVEGLKKEQKVLNSRLNAAKRKLALEMKLRDAAMSLSRLYTPKSPSVNGRDDPAASPRSHRSLIGHHEATMDKTDEELALSTRKCEELSQEIGDLERRVQQVNNRLLEHTAGILQMTHKGLKKNLKNNVPHTPESLASHNIRDSLDDFDDRSFYQPSGPRDDHAGQGLHGLGLEAVQDTEKRLEFWSGRLYDLIQQSHAVADLQPVPQPPPGANPTAAMEAYLAYIENTLGSLTAHPPSSQSQTRSLEDDSQQQLGEVNARLHQIIQQSGMPGAQSLPPPPDSPSATPAEHLSYLQAGITGLEDRLEKLLEQKSILTTQIQQQRELNSKSDAERDAHIADLMQQLAHVRKDLEFSENENQRFRDDLEEAMEQVTALRQELENHQEQHVMEDTSKALTTEQEARARAEAEVERLESVLEDLKRERDAQAQAHEAHAHAASEREALTEAHHAQLQSQANAHTEELNALRSKTDDEISRLQAVIDELQSTANTQAEATQARQDAEQQLLELQQALQQTRDETDAQVKEAVDARAHAESEVARLEESMGQFRASVSQLETVLGQLRGDVEALESRIKQVTEARAEAENDCSRLQAELREMEGEVVRAQTELTMAKAELDGAYGTRAQRAADIAANPAIQREFDELNTRNLELAEELAALKAGKPGSSDLQHRVELLERELRDTVDDYEVMTKASIEFEKEREQFEGVIDTLRDRCEQLETQLNEERINWMGSGRDGHETTSTMVLKNEFKKMMRDTRSENLKIRKADYDERRRLETTIRNLNKEIASLTGKPVVGQPVPAG
ncbi:involucrin repeat protein [Aspergillus saccharolyticus JOP 1030-1]|uniref:Involucrin repeat protein n=1 Tax=Aspergillus saccharolyticus JOP 1030-1 TaxID=1450539 RepID=A0A318ZG25_9EURO|nr:involucrin repeat protein [Aspergillus saccharolyticus JOP 1030-1]PYH45304.1 involucrin repeat protein [Aspergillus saccharolyticus JOP 1030-1]